MRPAVGCMTPLTADDLLGELLQALISERPPSPRVRAWFVDGVLRALRRDERWDARLGLADAGSPSLRRRLLMLERDSHLLVALQCVALDVAVTDWQRCQRAAELARKFVRNSWPQARRMSEPPVDWPAAKRALFHAARTGLPVPESPDAFRKILVDKAGGYSRNPSGRRLLAQLL